MSLEVFTIKEAPYHKGAWAYMDAACHHVQRKPDDLRRICAAVGARVIEYKGKTFVEMTKLAPSPAWKQLVLNSEQPQGTLWGSTAL